MTETALANMKTIPADIRTQCTYGASDQITADDRKTILTQLEAAGSSLRGNADMQDVPSLPVTARIKLTFMTDDNTTSYNITQDFPIRIWKRHRYYSDGDTPDHSGGGDKQHHLESEAGDIRPYPFKLRRDRQHHGQRGNALSANGATGTLSYSYTDAAGVTQTDGELKVTVYDTFEDWAKASQTADNTYNITDGEAVFIKESGALILSSDASSTIKSGRASLDVNYTKTGFNKVRYVRSITITAPTSRMRQNRWNI